MPWATACSISLALVRPACLVLRTSPHPSVLAVEGLRAALRTSPWPASSTIKGCGSFGGLLSTLELRDEDPAIFRATGIWKLQCPCVNSYTMGLLQLASHLSCPLEHQDSAPNLRQPCIPSA